MVVALGACGADEAVSVDRGAAVAVGGATISEVPAESTPGPTAATRPTLPDSTTTLTTTTTTLTTTTTTTTTTSTTTSTTGTTTTEEPVTTAAGGQGGPAPTDRSGSIQEVRLRFESLVADVSVQDLTGQALAILNDPRGWGQAGFRFVADPTGPFRVVLAEGSVVDELCLPLETFGTVSCQNGPVVALNADRWRNAVDHWVLGVDVYRGYLVNHEVGHLIGQRHPKPRCPIPGRPAGVMEQQTAGLKGCIGNPWPRPWELDHARRRPVVYAPPPEWGPDPVPANGES